MISDNAGFRPLGQFPSAPWPRNQGKRPLRRDADVTAKVDRFRTTRKTLDRAPDPYRTSNVNFHMVEFQPSASPITLPSVLQAILQKSPV